MTVIEEIHADHGATFIERSGNRVVADYGRPERTHQAVRNVVGAIELGYGIVEVTGSDRVSYVDNVVSNNVPREDGHGCYALFLGPQGKIETDLYVYNAAERLLLFFPPACAEPIAAEWREKIFIDDVEIRVVTDEFAVFGVHGAKATEKVASVLTGASAPEPPLSFVRGSIGDAGVTAIAGDALTGEESYEIICTAAEAHEVFDALINHGMNAVPFGDTVWNTLTLEAGTPLFESELRGKIPNVAGIRNALDFEKGCYVGQEVVSRVENRGRPSQRLVGITLDTVPSAGAAVFDGDASIGSITRAAISPLKETPIALAYVDYSVDTTSVTVRVDGEACDGSIVDLPFIEGSMRSLRLPTYE